MPSEQTYTAKEVATKIQQTNVNPEITVDDVKQLCQDCVQYGFDGVMLQPCWVPYAEEFLKGSDVKICTALGFPMGGATTESKTREMENVISLGADQVDFMPNFGFFKSGMYDKFQNEISEIVKAADGHVTKAMLEFGLLEQDEKARAAELAIEGGVTYVKNSSGWGKGGHATKEDIKLLKKTAGDRALVKASGGIRNFDDAIEILHAGASLIGASSGVKIVTGEGQASNDY